MTTYSHKLTIDDSERIALEAALKLMMQHCDDKVAEKAGPPYWAHRESCKRVLNKLHDAEPILKSTSSFCGPQESDE